MDLRAPLFPTSLRSSEQGRGSQEEPPGPGLGTWGGRRPPSRPLPSPTVRAGAGRGRRAGPGDARSGPERRRDAGPLTLLAPEAAGDQSAPLGALSPGVGAGLAGTGYRTDLDDLCLRHFLPARRFPDETRSQVFPFPLSPPFHFLNGRDAAMAPVPPPGA